jgi:hypothetical protein
MGFYDLIAVALIVSGMIPAHRAARASRTASLGERTMWQRAGVMRAIASIPLWCALVLLVRDDGWALGVVEWCWWIGIAGMTCVFATPQRRAARASTLTAARSH